MFQKLLLVSFACAASATQLSALPVKALALRGGAQLGSIDEKTMLLIQAAGTAIFGTEFLIGSGDWASERFWNKKPTQDWKQLSEAFSISLLLATYQAYNIATNGGDISSYGKAFTLGWVAWTLMHFKWNSEGTLITTGKGLGLPGTDKGQLGGGMICGIIAALSVYTFYM